MKRTCLVVLLVFSFLLCGCSSKKEEKMLSDFSVALSGRSDLSFVGKLRCEYDDRTVDFTLQYKQQEDGCLITVLQPEEIEGISVELDGNGSVLKYDELFVDTGELDELGLSPLSALPLLAESLRGSYMDAVRYEGKELVYTLIPADDISMDIWFSAEDMVPTHAEIISHGRLRVFCDLESWR